MKIEKRETNEGPPWKLSLAIYPFAAGAAAVNIFFIGLMIQALGFAAFTPKVAIIAGLIAGLPFAYITAIWIRSLVKEAERGQ